MSQLTRLGCGGVVVAVSLYHLVADGAGLAHFIASWAELARGEAIAAPPHLDRACMSARTPPCPSFEHQEYTVHKQPPSYMEQPPPMTSRIFEFLAQVRHRRAINHFQINSVCRSLRLRKLTSVGCVGYTSFERAGECRGRQRRLHRIPGPGSSSVETHR